MISKSINLLCDGEKLACVDLDPGTGGHLAVLCHGAGKSSKERSGSFALALSSRGILTRTFDFSGHGDSTGQLGDLTLERRRAQAACAIRDAWRVYGRRRLVLVGFSMSGQTLADLLPEFGSECDCVVMIAPAVYDEQVRDLPFEDEEFTEGIRRAGSWEESDAYASIRAFQRPVIVVTAGKDQVVLEPVVDELTSAAAADGGIFRVHLPDAPHRLSEWLSTNERDRTTVLDAIDRALGRGGWSD